MGRGTGKKDPPCSGNMNELFRDPYLVGPYAGERLGYKSEGDDSDFVYSPGFSGPLRERAAAFDGEGSVMQAGGAYPKRLRKLKRTKRLRRKRSTRRQRR